MREEVYIAYFDLMGFKQFILNNPEEYIDRKMSNIFREMEMALSHSRTIQHEKDNHMIVPNVEEAKLNCLNISDTILYWTNDCSLESLNELIMTSFQFNGTFNTNIFPVRGCLIKGTLHILSGDIPSNHESIYSVRCIYGKTLVLAHQKAECQDWAGTVIDESIINDFNHKINNTQEGVHWREMINSYCIKYKVPYKKDHGNQDEEYVFKLPLLEGINALKKNINQAFSSDNKPIDNDRVQQLLNNTLSYADYLDEIEN